MAPTLTPHNSFKQPRLQLKGSAKLKSEFTQGPISTMIQRIAREKKTHELWSYPPHKNKSGGPELLQVYALTYFCLQDIGRIRIRWVDNIYDHLSFEAAF